MGDGDKLCRRPCETRPRSDAPVNRVSGGTKEGGQIGATRRAGQVGFVVAPRRAVKQVHQDTATGAPLRSYRGQPSQRKSCAQRGGAQRGQRATPMNWGKQPELMG